ncbi:SWI/SNF and RSC complexes subunit arp9 [Paramyrothecium foliicola]|nr:SWI/SNF and RSC complexes subunit arp9 [Paramyrothecium foliicola]
MASAAGKWREEQILILCPGSRTTMAQLGCSELTLPTHRIPTRMFRDDNEWRPYYTFKRTKVVDGVEQEEWVEDVDEDKGAVWPIQGGRIVQMDAFLAFLDHVHGMLTTTYHNTPIMLMASPQWTRPDCETIAQYIFEKTRTPALCMIHSGIATQYGLKWPHMTVVDIGYEKVDVTAIHDGRVVNHLDLGSPGAEHRISGGRIFTQKLLEKLEKKGFTYDMAEQLKKSTICEVLPYAPGQDDLMELPLESTAGAAPSAASAAADSSSQPVKLNDPQAAKHTDASAEDNEAGANGEDDGVLDVAAIVTSGQTKEFLAKKEKEKEKGKGGGRKPKDKEADSGAQKPVRLPNSKRTHNTFAYEEIVQEEVKPNGTAPADEPKKTDQESAPSDKPVQPPHEGAPADAAAAPAPAPAPDATAAPEPAATNGTAPETETKPEPKVEAESEIATSDVPPATGDAAPIPAADPVPAAITATAAPVEPAPAAPVVTTDPPERKAKRVRRDVEVGLERFTFADRAEIDRIVTTIYRTIQGIDDMYMRPACWDNLVFVGNGARLRGLRENILQTLNARHLISPSTATMFTSELPSNMATPTGTGSQTPTGSFTGAPHQLPSSGVNPLLQAATTASTLGVASGGAAVGTPQAGSDAGGGSAATHHFHSQTPTSIKTPNMPTYLSEWTKSGFEEAMFLGAQVAARIAFCLHSNMDAQSVEAQRLMSLSRVDYNELGPKGIRTHSMLN